MATCGRGVLAAAAAAGVAVLASLATVDSAAAAPDSGAVVVVPIDPHGRLAAPRVGVGVGRPGARRPSVGAVPELGGSGGPSCSYVWERELEPALRRLGFGGTPAPEAHLYSVSCGAVSAGFLWLVPAAVPGGVGVGPAVLAARAYRELRLAAPRIRTSPPVQVRQLVRVPVWLWVDRALWAPRSVTARVPGLWARVTAEPVGVVWSLGDGTTLRCAGPGTPFVAGRSDAYAPSPDCGHTYTRAGMVTVTATVSWRVAWVAGDGSSGVLPALESRGSARLRVVQARAVNR